MADKYQEEVVKPGDRASKEAHKKCRDSYGNCLAVEIIPRQPGNFRGAVDFLWRRHILEAMIRREVKESVQNDGAGGKPQFFTLVGTPDVFYGLGWEILTMCLDDIARTGGFPAVFCNDLNVQRITDENYHLVQALLDGYGNALAKTRQVNITGEIAVMRNSITAFCDFNQDKQLIVTWGGTSIGLSNDSKLIDGSKVGVGQFIVGLEENGYRCNGGGKHTDIILAHCNNDPSSIPTNSELMRYIRKLTIPSVSYSHLISYVNGWNNDGSTREALVKMTGIAHITGGGVWGKLDDLLPAGCGADLNCMPLPPGVLIEAQDMSWDLPDLKINDLQAYGTFHGGCGMMVICETEQDARQLILHASDFGVRSKIVGQVTESPTKEIVIKSRFREGRILSSNELTK